MICNLCRSAEEGGVGIARRSFIVIFYFSTDSFQPHFQRKKNLCRLAELKWRACVVGISSKAPAAAVGGELKLRNLPAKD